LNKKSLLKTKYKKALNSKNYRHITKIISFSIVLLITINYTAYAAQPTVTQNMNIFQAATAIGREIYNNIKGIVTLFAAIAGAICGFLYMTSQDERKVEGAKTWGKRIVIGWIIINGFGLIVNTLQGWFGSAGWTP
jgi:hypothetical protein